MPIKGADIEEFHIWQEAVRQSFELAPGMTMFCTYRGQMCFQVHDGRARPFA